MTLTYIFHSGFVLETEKFILIFDYWLDLNGVVPIRKMQMYGWPKAVHGLTKHYPYGH